MLAIILSWICVFFVFISLGHFLLSSYKRIVSEEGSHNITDVFIIGLCVSTSLLSIISFWLPVNFSVLIVLLIISVLYWLVKHKALKEFFFQLKNQYRTYSLVELLPYVFLSFFFLLTPIWSFSVKLDPFIYHHANVLWNESYSIIPGLANLDEKFGFNSNYFLMLSLFSLRPLFGELIIGVQSLLAYLIAVSIYSEIIKSRFDIKRVSSFVVYIILIFLNQNEMSETSTDIIPTLIIFYAVSRLVLYLDLLKKNSLFYVIVPIALISFKLSSSLLILISLFPLYLLIASKRYKELAFLLFISALIIVPWLVRNVIISGYLVFPLYGVDLFSFDWEVPAKIVSLQKDFIHSYSIDKTGSVLSTFDVRNYYFYSTTVVLFVCAISLLYSFVFLVKNREVVSPVLSFVYIVLLFNILFWAISAPDVRFGYGVIFAAIFLAVYLFFSKKTISFLSRKAFGLRTKSVTLGAVLLLGFSIVWGYYGYRWASKYKNYLVNEYKMDPEDAWGEMLTTPMKMEYQKDREVGRENERFGVDKEFCLSPYLINDNVTFYVSSSRLGFVFSYFPAVSDCEANPDLLFHDYRLIEMRGQDIKDGFRYKTER